MFKVKTNNKEYAVAFDDDKKSGTIDGKQFELNTIKTKEGSYHVLSNNQSYNIEVVKADYATKNFVISVNGTRYILDVRDKFDELLHTLGFDASASNKVSEIKAPMPGLVLDIKIKEGDTVKKGDALLVLEAMKMENILKSPADGTVKKINVQKGNAVEKNQILINL